MKVNALVVQIVKKTTLTLLFLLIATTTTKTAISAENSIGWVDYNSTPGAFTAQFPENPEEKMIDRNEYKAYSAASTVDDVTYKIVFSIEKKQYSEEEKQNTLEQTTAFFAKAYEEKIKNQKKFNLNGISGMEASFGSTHKASVVFRVFFVDNTLFTQSVAANNKSVSQKNAEHFFNSFKITGVISDSAVTTSGSGTEKQNNLPANSDDTTKVQ